MFVSMRNDIRRSSLVEQVSNALRQYIDSENVTVGQKMPSENDLCQQFNVSRTTIREALRFLQARGYVDLYPNRGAFVAAKSHQDTAEASNWLHLHAHEVLDVLEVRCVIEPLAAELAARRATDAQRYAIRGLATMFEESANAGDQAAMVALDERFHETVAEASGNAFIQEINGIVSEGLRAFRLRTFAIDTHGSEAVGPHNAISEAIVNKNAENAEQLMRKHVESNISITRNYLK